MIIKDFAVSPYGLAFITALFVSFLIVYILLVKRGVPRIMIGYSMFLNLILILYGAKMYTVLTSGFRVSLLNSGISSIGGVIGLLLGIYIFGLIYKERRQLFLEAYVLVIPMMYGIAKIGCYLVGCCHGISYSGAFAVSYENKLIQGGPYFPVQITETIVFVSIFLIGILLYQRGNSKYTVSLIIILCAVAKFSLEYLREEHVGKILSVNQVICIGFLIWGMTRILIRRGRKYE